jgi:predicted nucleotidyltransferase
MNGAADGFAEAAAIDFARRLVPLWEAALGSELLGVYLLGSLAHGGFSARYSDVDIAVVTTAGVPAQVLEHVHGEAVALSADWGPKLSVFWTDRRFALGRFPPLDRIDYLDHAVVLMERQSVRPPRPALEEIRDYLAGAPFANWAERARGFALAPSLAPQDRKAYLRTLLYPARLCFSWVTGRMDANDNAVAHLAKAPPAGLDMALIGRALQCRQADADPDPLFPARTVLPAQVDTCAALLARRAPRAD